MGNHSHLQIKNILTKAEMIFQYIKYKLVKNMNKKPIMFAPMEGITDPIFRSYILTHSPEWDYIFTDFYRIPSQGNLHARHIINHLGETIFENQALRAKSPFQVLASPNSKVEECAKILEELKLPWVDLNSGCPSKKVNSHHGGAWLMAHPDKLKKIIATIRKNYYGKLSVKIRSGYLDNSNFDEILKVIEGEGVDQLIVHPRTKLEMYLGHSDWLFIKRAKEMIKIPVIGNGDIKSCSDILEMESATNCDGFMIGRGAIGRLELASKYYGTDCEADSEFNPKKYTISLINHFRQFHSDEVVLKRIKSLTHYIFNEDKEKRTKLLRSDRLDNFIQNVINIDS